VHHQRPRDAGQSSKPKRRGSSVAVPLRERLVGAGGRGGIGGEVYSRIGGRKEEIVRPGAVRFSDSRANEAPSSDDRLWHLRAALRTLQRHWNGKR